MKGRRLSILKSKKLVAISLVLAILLIGYMVFATHGMKTNAAGSTEPDTVADGMLDVKMQIQSNEDGTKNMRLVSSVNGLGYYKVGFEICYDKDGSGTFDDDGDGNVDSDEFVRFSTKKVSKRISAHQTGVTYKYSPKVVDTDSGYFITGTLMNLSESLQGKDFYIRAYCISLKDKATKTYGTGRYFNINDATNNAIINIPIEVAEGALTVGNTANVTVAGVSSSATVEAYKDGYAHLNVTVPANATVTETKEANKTLLASANKIEVIGESGSPGSAIYRNLDSTYKNKNAGDNSWYTVDTSADAFVIATDADLYGLASAASSIGNKPVYLVADITLNSGTVDSWENSSFAGLTNWTPINGFSGTFDGQGHTISGLYMTSPSQNVGMFRSANTTISNFSLRNSYLEGTYAASNLDINIGSIVGAFGGTMQNVYSDAKVVTTKGWRAGGLVGLGTYANLTMEGCWFAGDVVVNSVCGNFSLNVGGFVGESTKTVQLNDCMYTGNISATYTHPNVSASSKDFRVGGFIGRCSTNVTIEDCLSNGTVSAVWQKNSSLDYTASGAQSPTTITNVASLAGRADGTLTISDVYDFNKATTKAGDNASTSVATTAITGKSLGAKVLRLNDSLLLGADGCRYTTLDFENTWAAVEGGLPVLKTFAETPMDLDGVTNLVDYGWYDEYTGETTDPYILDNSKDLYAFSILSNSSAYSTVNNKAVQLKADTEFELNKGTVAEWKENEFSGLNNWHPIPEFTGTFNGNGSTISGLYHYANANRSSYAGLFKKTTGTLCDFSLKNSYLKSDIAVQPGLGSIVGTASGTLKNIYSGAEVVTTQGMWAGGLAGCGDSTLTMTGCWFDGNVTMTYTLGGYNIYGGGFVGQAKGALTLEDCLFTGDMDVTYKQPSGNTATSQNFSIGSFAGYCSGKLQLDGCISDGNVSVFWEDPVKTTVSIERFASLIGAMDARTATKTLSVSSVYDFNKVTKQVEGEASAKEITIADGSNVIPSTKALRLNESSLLGADGCRYTTLDFESEYGWAAVGGKLPQLKYFTETPMDLDGVTSLVDYGWYSERNGAQATPYVLSDSKDLCGFSMISTINSFNKLYVQLAADIDVNNIDAIDWDTGELKSGYEDYSINYWKPIGPLGFTFTGYFDGQNHKIRGIYCSTDTQYAGLFGLALGTIQNISLENSYFESTKAGEATIGSILGYGGGTMQNVYSDATVVTTQGYMAGGLVGYGGYSALNMTGCWFDGDVVVNDQSTTRPFAGGFVGQAAKELKMKDCLFTGTVDATWECSASNSTAKQVYVGGFVGMSSGAVTIEDCLSDGTVYAYWNTTSEATPTMTGVATLIGSIKVGITVTDVYDFNTVTQQTDGGVANGNEPSVIKYATYNNSNADTTGGAIALSTRVLHLNKNLLLGADGCRYTALDFENTWAAVDGELPQLKYFTDNEMDLTGITNLVDYAWYYEGSGTETSPYELSDSKDLYGFSIISTIDSFSSKYVELAANTTFTLNEGTVATWKTNGFEGLNNWKPIVNFAGYFDGQGSTIKGLYCTTDVEKAGMFKNTTTNATISNFSLEDSYLVSTAYPTANIGSIVGYAGGSMTNVHSSAEVVTDGGFKAGGLVGHAVAAADAAYEMTNCSFDGNVKVNYLEPHSTNWGLYAGGLVGQAANAITLTGCSFTGNIDVTYMRADANYSECKTYTGGFVGRCSDTATITNYTNSGTIDVTWLKNSGVDYSAEDALTPTSFDNYLNKLIGRIDDDKLTTSEETANDTTITTSITEGGIFKDYPEIRSNLLGTVADKYNMGEHDYGLLAESVTQDNYNTYITALINAGFVKHSDNGTTGMDNGRIYTTNLTKDDITLTVSYIEKTSEIHLTASYNLELSEYLNYNADSVPVDSSQETKLHMPELNCVGSSFIIQLKNGHFVIEDGGNPNDAPYLLDYLESLVPEGEKPVIEGWFISHPHVDHFGALQAIANTAEYRNRIYVEGVYFTIMTQALMEYMLPGSTSGEYKFAQEICAYNKSLVRENGEQTKFHRTIMGQKYYFCDVEIDVVYTLEQSCHDGTDRNDNSTWLMYRIEGQRVLNTADANTDSFNDILYYYDDDYLDVDVYTTPHHGINVTTEFNSKLGLDSNDIVLYSNWRKGSLWWTTNHMTDEEKAEMDRLYTEVYTSGDATKIIGTNPDFLEAYDANINLQDMVGADNVYSRGVVVNFMAGGRTVEVLEPVVWKYSQYCVDGTYYPERDLYTNE